MHTLTPPPLHTSKILYPGHIVSRPFVEVSSFFVEVHSRKLVAIQGMEDLAHILKSTQAKILCPLAGDHLWARPTSSKG